MAQHYGRFGRPHGFAIALYGAPFVVFIVLAVAYFVIGESLWGTSPGKHVMGLQVRSTTGDPVSLGRSLVRNLLRVVDWLPGAYLLGMLSIVFSRRDQRIGDRLAGTIVVSWLATASADTEPSLEAAQSRRRSGLLALALATCLAGVGLFAVGTQLGNPASVTGSRARTFVTDVVDSAFRTGSYEELESRSWDQLVATTGYEAAFNEHLATDGYVDGVYTTADVLTSEVELQRGEVSSVAEYWMDVNFTNGPGVLAIAVAYVDGEFRVVGWRARLIQS